MKLLALIALVMMPLGMTGAPALAGPVDHAGMMAGHCDQQKEQDKAPASKKMDCAAACTAIPAPETAEPAPVLRPRAPRTIALVAPFAGIVLEIATPPPRLV